MRGERFDLTAWRYDNDAEFRASIVAFAFETGNDVQLVLDEVERYRDVPYAGSYDLYARYREPGYYQGAFARALDAEMANYRSAIVEQLNMTSPIFDIMREHDRIVTATMTRRQKVRRWIRRHRPHPITAAFRKCGYVKDPDARPWKQHVTSIRISRQAIESMW